MHASVKRILAGVLTPCTLLCADAPGNKRQRVWERRLLKDFRVAPVAAVDAEEQLVMAAPPENETGLQRFRRVAKLAVLQASTMRWRQVRDVEHLPSPTPRTFA